MTLESPARVPQLAACTDLFFDAHCRRWVLRAPHQVVFLDALSLAVLRVCDGLHSLDEIANRLEMALCPEGLESLEAVQDIVRHFEARGILRVLPVSSATTVRPAMKRRITTK